MRRHFIGGPQPGSTAARRVYFGLGTGSRRRVNPVSCTKDYSDIQVSGVLRLGSLPEPRSRFAFCARDSDAAGPGLIQVVAAACAPGPGRQSPTGTGLQTRTDRRLGGVYPSLVANSESAASERRRPNSLETRRREIGRRPMACWCALLLRLGQRCPARVARPARPGRPVAAVAARRARRSQHERRARPPAGSSPTGRRAS